MSSWANIWGMVLIASLALFTATAVTVTVAGFKDIRSMLRRIGKKHPERGGDGEETK